MRGGAEGAWRGTGARREGGARGVAGAALILRACGVWDSGFSEAGPHARDLGVDLRQATRTGEGSVSCRERSPGLYRSGSDSEAPSASPGSF